MNLTWIGPERSSIGVDVKRIVFGDYVDAYKSTKNALAARRASCIALNPIICAAGLRNFGNQYCDSVIPCGIPFKAIYSETVIPKAAPQIL